MYCLLYVLRFEGRKLPKERVRETGRPGWLYMGQSRTKIHPQVDAVFTPDEAGSEPVVLQHAHVKLIDKGGIMIYGSDAPGYNPSYQRQTWWVVPRQGGYGVRGGAS